MLKVNNLHVEIESDLAPIKPVNGVSFNIKKGEILGLVGESGCGKSLTALSILKLIQKPINIVEGSIEFNNNNLLKNSTKKMRKIRGNDISMIFQNPRESLNPVFKVSDQLINIYQTHKQSSKKEAYNKALEMLNAVNIPDASQRIFSFPHELSGGMCQRIMIAMALLCEPQLLIADEPTTALDVTVQAEVLDLILSLVKLKNMSCLFITHDLGVISQICDRVAVMYAGQIVEIGEINDIFANPCHPYTEGLLNSTLRADKITPIHVIPGEVADPTDLPKGCPFSLRCSKVYNKCHEMVPDTSSISETHKTKCHLFQ
tara:strand:- start:7096 stop:8046 length:951 start_codon:yes stop_codon:yes gene_type:complete